MLRPSTVVNRAASKVSNSAALNRPVSSWWTGVSSAPSRESHSFSIAVKEAGSTPSAACHAAIESRSGVVSTPP
jgi:hypothetical protein